MSKGGHNAERLSCDVLVVGSGLAGLRAALAAVETGVRTLVVSMGDSASEMAGADLSMPGYALAELGFKGDSNDTEETWAADIHREGMHVNDPALVRSYTEGAASRMRELLNWGLKPMLQLGGRAILIPGEQLVATLRKKAEQAGVVFYEKACITDLVCTDNRVAGAVGCTLNNNCSLEIRAKAVVLATGGCHNLFSDSTGPWAVGGDAQAMALRAGVELVDLEFINFCPNVPITGPYRGHLFLYILSQLVAMRHTDNQGALLVEQQPNWMQHAIAHSEWDKLLLSYLTTNMPVRSADTEQVGLRLCLVPDQDEALARAAALIPDFVWRGTDYSPLVHILRQGEPVEVGIAAHFWGGGIRIDPHGATTLEGLYAAGEVAGGLFGANRVASAITAVLVQGANAGKNAALFAKESDVQDRAFAMAVEALARPTTLLGKTVTEKAEATLELAGRALGMQREPAGLQRSAQDLANLLAVLPLNSVYPISPLPDGRSAHRDYRLRNLTLLAHAVTLACLERDESRGFHYRTDQPHTVSTWQHANTVATLENGTVIVRRELRDIDTADVPVSRIDYLEALQQAVSGSQTPLARSSAQH